MSENTVNQRIKDMLNHFAKGNKSAFAKAVGISNQSLGEIVGGRQNAPSFVALQKIALAYPSVSLHWLVLGEGPMFELTDNDPAYKLELFASEVADKIEEMVESGELSPAAAELTTGYPSEENIFYLRQNEEVERAGLIDAIENERKAVRRLTSAGKVLTAAGVEELATLEAVRRATEQEYVAATRDRMRAERARWGYETNSVHSIYKLGVEHDREALYGGLLSTRLNISSESAERLVKSGKIRATYIDGEGYRITEQAVRTFLGEF